MVKRQMVRIPKKEYLKLKRMERVDLELLEDIAKGLNDIMAGRVREWK